MITVVLGLLVLTAAITLALRDLLVAVICLAVFSLLSALLFYLLQAPDVAIAEAAVGAGVSTVIFLWTVRRTSRHER